MVYKGTCFFPINMNSSYCVLQRTKSINTIVSISKIINGNVNIIFYDSKDVLLLYLRYISQNYYNAFSLLHIPMKEHDNIMYKNNRTESIEFEKSVSIVTQDTTYD